jgi:hypothetical protein
MKGSSRNFDGSLDAPLDGDPSQTRREAELASTRARMNSGKNVFML